MAAPLRQTSLRGLLVVVQRIANAGDSGVGLDVTLADRLR
jgi:hypothetical protein